LEVYFTTRLVTVIKEMADNIYIKQSLSLGYINTNPHPNLWSTYANQTTTLVTVQKYPSDT